MYVRSPSDYVQCVFQSNVNRLNTRTVLVPLEGDANAKADTRQRRIYFHHRPVSSCSFGSCCSSP